MPQPCSKQSCWMEHHDKKFLWATNLEVPIAACWLMQSTISRKLCWPYMPCRTQITFKDNWKPSTDSLKECMISNEPADLRCRFRVPIGIQNPQNHETGTTIQKNSWFLNADRPELKGINPSLHVWEPRSTRLGELAVSCDLFVQLMAARRILVWAAPWLKTQLRTILEKRRKYDY